MQGMFSLRRSGSSNLGPQQQESSGSIAVTLPSPRAPDHGESFSPLSSGLSFVSHRAPSPVDEPPASQSDAPANDSSAPCYPAGEEAAVESVLWPSLTQGPGAATAGGLAAHLALQAADRAASKQLQRKGVFPLQPRRSRSRSKSLSPQPKLARRSMDPPLGSPDAKRASQPVFSLRAMASAQEEPAALVPPSVTAQLADAAGPGSPAAAPQPSPTQLALSQLMQQESARQLAAPVRCSAGTAASQEPSQAQQLEAEDAFFSADNSPAPEGAEGVCPFCMHSSHHASLLLCSAVLEAMHALVCTINRQVYAICHARLIGS